MKSLVALHLVDNTSRLLMNPFFTLSVTLVLIAQSSAQDWPRLLGPIGNGSLEAKDLAWSRLQGKLPLAWQANAGFGAAPVVVEGGRVYTFGLFKPDTKPAVDATPTLEEIAKGTFTSAELPGTPEGIKKADYPLAYRGDLYAQCLEIANGKPIWATKLTDHGLAFKTSKHSGTGWELASPLIADGKLYIHTHTGHLFCINAANGKLHWDVNLFAYRMSTWFGGQQGNSCIR